MSFYHCYHQYDSHVYTHIRFLFQLLWQLVNGYIDVAILTVHNVLINVLLGKHATEIDSLSRK